MPLINKREAKLQAILEAETLSSQSLRPSIKKSSLLQFGDGGVRSLEKNFLKSNRRAAAPVFALDNTLEYNYKGKVNEEKKAMTQDLRIIEGDESEEEVKGISNNDKDLKMMKPEENF